VQGAVWSRRFARHGPASIVRTGIPVKRRIGDGPALVVRTRWGERRWFTVPEAEEAAGLLRAWPAQRRVAVAG